MVSLQVETSYHDEATESACGNETVLVLLPTQTVQTKKQGILAN